MGPLHALRIRNLENTYNVRISDDAQHFAFQVIREHGDKPRLEGMDPIELVEAACRILRKSLDSKSEEKRLDWAEYFLDRAFVEVMELRKEKAVGCRRDILPRVEKELAELTSEWDSYKTRWSPLLDQQRHESGKRPDMLRRLMDELLHFMATSRAGSVDAEKISKLPPLLNGIIDAIQQTVHSSFKNTLVVEPHEVAQAASNMTDLPEKCFLYPFELRLLLPLKGLESRLSQKFIELDGVINKMGHTLLKQKSVNGPFGSFLLLGPFGCGRSTLGEALAEELYGDTERFLELDLSELRGPNFTLRLLHRLTRFKSNGCVVMFENFEASHTFMHEALPKILRDGRLTLNDGGAEKSASFENDIVLVSTHIGHEVFLDCECLHTTLPKLPFREVLIEPALLHEGISSNDCHFRRFCTMVANQFNSDFLNLFNDLLVFPWLSIQNHMAISRLQTRYEAKEMCSSLKKGVILYPSDAAVMNMLDFKDILEIGAHSYEDWYHTHMMPKLNENDLKNEAGDTLIIYIDQLVGLEKESSFRVENGRHLEKDPTYKRYKESLARLRSLYRKEKLQAHQINKLQTICSCLCELVSEEGGVNIHHARSEARDAIKLISRLLDHDDNQVQLDYFSYEDEDSLSDRKIKRAKICFERLRNSLKQRDKTTQVITEALLRKLQTSYEGKSKESNHLPASFLCLGLTPKSKKQLAESLGEHLLMDDGEKMLFEVDLSLCQERGSFFGMNNDLLLVEAVNLCPHCVIIFHQLEMAHMSVFSTILSILDCGVAKDNGGNKISFKDCVVVIISDLGNKEIIGQLNRDWCPEDYIDRMDVVSTSEEGEVGSSSTKEMVTQEAAASSSTDEMDTQEAVGSSQPVEMVTQEAVGFSQSVEMAAQEAAGPSQSVEMVKQEAASSSQSVAMVIQEAASSSRSVVMVKQKAASSLRSVVVKHVAGSSSQSVAMVKHEAGSSSQSVATMKRKACSSSLSVAMVEQEAALPSSTNEMGLRGLRFEILYRLDQLLLFDPLSDDQLSRFAMLAMKPLEETTHVLYKAFYDLLNVEIDQKSGFTMYEIMRHIKIAFGKVLKIRS